MRQRNGEDYVTRRFLIYAYKYLPPCSRIFFEELLVTLLVLPV
jgi:hypothetical protein